MEEKLNEQKLQEMKDAFQRYERVRLRGNHNMFSSEALRETGLSREMYKKVMTHYNQLHAAFADK